MEDSCNQAIGEFDERAVSAMERLRRMPRMQNNENGVRYERKAELVTAIYYMIGTFGLRTAVALEVLDQVRECILQENQ